MITLMTNKLVRYTLWWVLHFTIVTLMCIYGEYDQRASAYLLVGYLNTVVVCLFIALYRNAH